MAGLTLSLDSRPNNIWVLAASGRPLPTDAEALDKVIDEAIASRPSMVVVDCAGLEFIGSFGIGALLRLAKAVETGGGKVRLSGVSPMIMKILQASRLDHRMPVFATVDAAIG
jgi:anti-anti-sigma factor